jgi:hypothetical protein
MVVVEEGRGRRAGDTPVVDAEMSRGVEETVRCSDEQRDEAVKREKQREEEGERELMSDKQPSFAVKDPCDPYKRFFAPLDRPGRAGEVAFLRETQALLFRFSPPTLDETLLDANRADSLLTRTIELL